MENLCTATARELTARMKQGEFTAEELTRAYLARIEKYDHKLHVIAELDPTAIAQACRLDACGDRSLPLFGLPILIKDNIDVSGLHTTAGSLALNDNVAAADAPVVAALRRAGAVILGKTNMTEFANYTTQGMPNGYSSRGGQVIGAYAPDMNPGGSSTGSGVAVSAGLCAAAIGTDTMFSVVGCAAQNGITGLKPPIGALSAVGIVPICHTMDSAGPLTRDLADALSTARIASRIGKTMPVLICGCEEDGQLYGRAMCQAPDVDGVVYVDGGEVGTVRNVIIEDTLLYEMEGTCLEP